MITVLKWILLIIALVLLGLLSYATAFILDWPAWAAWLAFVGYLSLIALGILVIRAIGVWRRRHFSEETQELRRQAQEEKNLIWSRRSGLTRQWRQMIRQLHRSKFKTRGNPVYALPWFLMLGAPQSGKTLAIKGSKLSVPFAGSTGGAEQGYVGGSRWWLLEETMVLDVPGSFAFHRGSGDRAEWRQFLALLHKHRRDLPINGVVITLAADTLLNGGVDELREQAVTLRERLDDMVLRLGINFPVYILVTKCDQIQGMTKFFQHFPREVLNQAMGILNERHAEQGVPERFLQRSFRRIGRRMDRLRLAMVGNADPLQVDARELVFPEEFQSLQKPLETVVKLIFEKRSHHESPYFRAIYFSSAEQAGMPYSSILPNIGFADQNLPLNPSQLSFFLRDFFGKVLRRDKILVSFTRQALNMHAFTQNAGAMAWVVVCVIAAVFLSTSFTRNLTILRQAAGDIPATITVSGDFNNDLGNLERFRKAIFSLVDRNRGWWLPSMGLTQSRDVEDKLTTIFTKKFFDYVLAPVDRDIFKTVKTLSQQSEARDVATYIDLFTKRINLLEKVRGDRYREADRYQKDLPNFEVMLGKQRAPNERSPNPGLMKANYVAYLLWENDGRLLQTEYDKQKANLQSILSQEDLGLNWLTAWANLQENLQDVTFREFWGGELANPIRIRRAYTVDGYAAILNTIHNIEKVQVAKDLIIIAKQEFEKRYRHEYFQEWENFIRNFSKGEALYRGKERRLELAARLSTQDSPFNNLLEKAAVGVAPALELSDKKETQVPYWYWHIVKIQQLRDANYKQFLKGGNTGPIPGLAKLNKIKMFINPLLNQDAQIKQDRRAVEFVDDYGKSIETMSETAAASKAAFETAQKAFAQSESVITKPDNPVLLSVKWGQEKLKKELSVGGRPEEDVFWDLLRDQFRILWHIILEEAQAHMQDLWTEEVIADTANMDPIEKRQALQAEGGKVWVFRDKYIKDFLEKKALKQGRYTAIKYSPKVVFNESMRFSQKLLTMLDAGPFTQRDMSKEYEVSVEAFPTDTNSDATVRPHSTRLTLKCKDDYEIVNVQHYPPPKIFKWKRDDCGKVELEMLVGTLALQKEYEDFPEFLKTFLAHDGSHTFSRLEFKQFAGLLTGYKVNTITVNYKFRNYQEVIAEDTQKPPVPEVIVEIPKNE